MPNIIFCVDDDRITLNIIKKSLSKHQCVLNENGQDCLANLDKYKPDLILLDINMPDISGLDLCKKIKEKCNYDVPIIFLSANDTLDDRLKGYESGCDDYVCKPIQPKELQAKVDSSIRRIKLLDKVHEQLKESKVSVDQVMTTMGELSSVIHFLQSTFSCHSYQDLAQKIIQAHQDLGLEISIEMIIDGKKIHYSTGDIEIPLEESVFEFVSNKGRLVSFGTRCAVNFTNISIIIRNMPVDNPDLVGRIRDYFALLAEGANAKIESLKTQILICNQREDLLKLIHQLQSTIGNLDNESHAQQQFSELIMSSLADKIEDTFIPLGLSESQEETIRSLMNEAEEQMTTLHDNSVTLEEHFTAVSNLIKQAILKTKDTPEVRDKEHETKSSAIELF